MHVFISESVGDVIMNMTENANMIQILEKLGWTGEQINKFMLGIEGRLTVDEAVNLIKSLNNNKM